MRKTSFIIIVSLIAWMAIEASADSSTVKIYLNPGHGSWGPNDRPMPTIAYPNLSSTGRPDTCGFYESNTNMWKVYGLYDELIKMGVDESNIKLSRWKSGPYPYTGEDYTYNKPLSVICAEVNTFGADMFLSVHSNALTDGTSTNYPLFLYRGTDASELVAGSKAMCNALWQYFKYGSNEIDHYSRNATDIRGDITFYGSSSTTGYLGVLKHSSPGFLSEGYFHTYQPARHRALNIDYCKMEGVRYARGIRDYFSLNTPSTGYIMGTIKDKDNTLEHDLYHYASGSVDAYKPINGATVKLYKNGELVSTYTTDNNYNGVFVFRNLEPGTYNIDASADGYNDISNQSVTVTANSTTCPKYYMTGGAGEEPLETVKHIYAYNLRNTKNEDDSYTFTFNANSDAQAAELIFTDTTSGTMLGNVVLNEVKEGSNSITLKQSDLPGTEGAVMNWAVKLTGKTVSQAAKLNNDDVIYNYTRACVAVDNSPESDYMGRFYVIDRIGSSSASNGLWAFNADYTRINSSVLRGGETFGNPYRLATDENGKIYIADWSDGHSGVFVASPNDLEGTFTQFFEGIRDSNGIITNNGVQVGCSNVAVEIAGTGSATKMYTFLEDFEKNNVAVYNVGQPNGTIATSWGTSPSSIIQVNSLMLNGNSQIADDTKGGIWVSQRRTKGQNLATTPSLIHVDEDGSINFNSGNDLTSLNGSPYAGFAVHRDGSILAIGDGDNNIQVYDITWTGSTPTLTLRTTLAGGVGNIQQMAFDYAGNLVVAGTSIAIYTIPTENNQCTTPAKRSLTIVKNAIVPEEYEIKKDIDTYDDVNNVRLTSNWIRSVKSEYANIDFESNGTFNRGMAVSGTNIYLSGRMANSSTTESYLDVYDKTTGRYIKRLTLDNNVNAPYYPCNDVMSDDKGNVLVSNLTLHVNSQPLIINKVDTISGNTTQVACLTCDETDARVDYCSILGDVNTGNFTVMAATASNNQVIAWKHEDGNLVNTLVTTITSFYPTSATTFGYAPRVMPVSEQQAIVKGSFNQFTLYNLTDGTIAQSVGSSSALSAPTLNANGGAMFSLDGMNCIVYPYNDHTASNGNQFALAVGNTASFDSMNLTQVFPAQGIGKVNSQTFSAPVTVEPSGDGKSASVYIYVPGQGLASYTVTSLKQEQQHLMGDVNCDGDITAADITALYDYLLNNDLTFFSTSDVNGDNQITSADVTEVYNLLLGIK